MRMRAGFVAFVEIQVQQQHGDARLAEEAQLPAFRMRIDHAPDAVLADVRRSPRSLRDKRSRRGLLLRVLCVRSYVTRHNNVPCSTTSATEK